MEGLSAWGHRQFIYVTGKSRVYGPEAGWIDVAVGAYGLSFMIASVFSLK